jgi:hypothetical protein
VRPWQSGGHFIKCWARARTHQTTGRGRTSSGARRTIGWLRAALLGRVQDPVHDPRGATAWRPGMVARTDARARGRVRPTRHAGRGGRAAGWDSDTRGRRDQQRTATRTGSSASTKPSPANTSITTLSMSKPPPPPDEELFDAMRGVSTVDSPIRWSSRASGIPQVAARGRTDRLRPAPDADRAPDRRLRHLVVASAGSVRRQDRRRGAGQGERRRSKALAPKRCDGHEGHQQGARAGRLEGTARSLRRLTSWL